MNSPAMPSIPDPTEPTVPWPPRYWWLKRGAAAVVLMIVGLLLLRVWWGHVADRRWHALVDAAHSRGEPILPEDFDEPSVPPNENAAATLQKAAGLLVTNESVSPGSDVTSANVAEVNRVLKADAPALQLARAARHQPLINWQVRARTPVYSTFPPAGLLDSQRHLANILKWEAMSADRECDDADAVESLRDLVHQADVLGHGPASTVTELVSDGVQALACDCLYQIAPSLRIADEGSPPEGRAASAAQVRALIGELLDERATRASSDWCWEGERMMALDTWAALFDNNRSVYLRLHRPMVKLDILRWARNIESMMSLSRSASWPDALSHAPPSPQRREEKMFRVTHALSDSLSPAMYVLRTPFITLTERRAAAIMLAIRLYRVDHLDMYPDSLTRLVPDYLPGVPVDPMAPHGVVFRYVNDTKRTVLYSVGVNGRDDGGQPTIPHRDGRWRDPDMVFPLAPLNAATEPSTETHDDH